MFKGVGIGENSITSFKLQMVNQGDITPITNQDNSFGTVMTNIYPGDPFSCHEK
ncbi:hypothetical protein JCM19240_170 [Vibrio maritimus]|uniref:Uncharacterized protein n=1 Tax=Vibrio maritimus TaxID=990268 RepID=A0A090U480_9VIBR|nr:hypothetical protein JCM19240_170 [Vibrio maritimus]